MTNADPGEQPQYPVFENPEQHPDLAYLPPPGGEGRPVIDSVDTARNIVRSQEPRLSTSILSPGDVLHVTASSDGQGTTHEFVVGEIMSSLSFGNSAVTTPAVQLTPAEGGETVRLVASRVPGSHMFAPGALVTGWNMITEPHRVVKGKISDFDLRRPDEHGELQPVRFNAQPTPSASYEQALSAFTEISDMLEATRGDPDARVFDSDSWRGYRQVIDDGEHQGVVLAHGYEARTRGNNIYSYDVASKTLRAISYHPSRGIMQVAILENVTDDVLGIAFHGDPPDWREVSYDSGSLHVMTHRVPATTYTWLRPDQEEPIVTVSLAGDNPGAWQAGYDTFEADIYPGEQYLRIHTGPHVGERPAELLREEQVGGYHARAEATLSHRGDRNVITIGDQEIDTPAYNPARVEALVSIAREVLTTNR